MLDKRCCRLKTRKDNIFLSGSMYCAQHQCIKCLSAFKTTEVRACACTCVYQYVWPSLGARICVNVYRELILSTHVRMYRYITVRVFWCVLALLLWSCLFKANLSSLLA